MEIIVCACSQNKFVSELIEKISLHVTKNLISVFSLKAFFDLMRSKVAGHMMIVFMVSSLDELHQLSANRQKLYNAKYIFILAKDDPSMVSTALSLYPRYISYTQDGFDNVCMVLTKIIRTYKL